MVRQNFKKFKKFKLYIKLDFVDHLRRIQNNSSQLQTSRTCPVRCECGCQDEELEECLNGQV